MIKKYNNILPALFLLCTQSLYAQKLSWEIGAGLAGFDIPLYPGSAQHKQYLIPVPYVKLKSEYLEVDRGIKGFLFSSPNVRLDISGELGVPVRSKDSAIRQGMPNLDTVLQLGPSVEITLSGSRLAKDELRLELPVRVAVATDIKSIENVGWIFEPRLTYEHRREGMFLHAYGLEYSVTLGLRYGSRDYHSYYYDVAPQFETAERLSFASDAGYSALVVNAVAGWRQDQWLYWLALQYRNLNNTVYENSPLVENKNYLLIGIGVSWVFASSL